MIHNDKFYQVIQGRSSSVGYFKKKSNAKKYTKQFNTKAHIDSLRIIERSFLDKSIENPDE